MAPSGSKLRFSFQTKVLLPVLAALVLVPAVTVWIVDQYVSQQAEVNTQNLLHTVEEVFINTVNYRNRELTLRFGGLVNNQKFRALVKLADSQSTLDEYLKNMLVDLGPEAEVLIVTNERGEQITTARRDPGFNTVAFGKVAAPAIRKALESGPGTVVVSSDSRTFNLTTVPIPMIDGGPLVGVLAVATRISHTDLQNIKAITKTDILLVAGSSVAATTVDEAKLPADLLQQVSAMKAGPAVELKVIMPGENSSKEHFVALTAVLPATDLRYVLLSSYERVLAQLQHTRTMLLGIIIVGVLVSGLAVWFLIRRITQPLRELRDSAEAVGRGDFSHRVTRFANDETGELAQAFNQMTANLQKSLADLEKTVGTLKNTQAQLIQSEKLSAVGQFVAGIAHELNNPLTTVIGFSELLEQNEALDPKTKTQLGYIGKSALRCHKIVHSLLGFSRQHEPENRLLLLHDVADAVLEIVAYDMRTNNIEIARDYETDPPPVRGDAHQLQQVILNIVSNARQAIEAFRRDGKITLSTRHDANHVTLHIKDNGPGIRKENLSKIFDPFFTTKPQGKGTGLGLSLTYGIIQEHHGRIRVESEPGDGAEFIIELPIADPNVSETKSSRSVSARPWPGGLKILAVDDEESILHLVRDVLQTDGHAVDTASTGMAAHELIAKTNYDVIVSDWKMPGLNGMQLFEDLQTRNPKAASRMLFMTGDVIKETFQEFLKKHDRMCLPKPFSVREFQAAVAKLANKNNGA